MSIVPHVRCVAWLPLSAGCHRPLRKEAKEESSQSGTTILEVMIGITVLAVGALAALSTLTSSSALDDDLKERSTAVRAAMSKMEAIAAYDYNDQITNLVNYWSLPANKDFQVDGIAPLPGAGGLPSPHGSISFNTADPDRIQVTVTVSWLTRHGNTRSFSLPRTMTEVVH